ncbi:MAG: hypothetical protein A3C93_02880 [Candidatus Lloydbacteria bacterium RIFCSPHIGHO2_02_FULL_54_17]|uniref:Exonuclease domain-containing protein n=1 Tax=Candidatus Lloydbacteria bacterium RIFCSPHIGHO2_02_FULL_54_17 TaxID=1798664 RepID=A0A1G2DAH5_9BACT|nr:MAG: hypothetical protein A2762_04750 [Candidatus Lloydbacteria bacterium RIFCSPHIGHO2_01_FULL_54_11]OGZ10616.1 MAG: hypothetical protein A3C93_02880 [Candidatus Lloydbacteria bacterium RIFCSPHIGHO2_02_FULL_54_17]OGZ13651.1 MAG: hypothetical protein A2948_03070 [Candidatus Lloydbacteria bacterium RIFCSPLOWO2_01_FULL_54_18]OGZ16089.1 MAG: hypothetical protein A3H76_01525 [Candidatus Lloydbacteria bacterium RIFCSPLOWO2_02_FULL_54_12]
MKKRKLAFLDIETTGLDPYRHEVIEVGIVLAEQKKDLFGKQSLELVSEHEFKLKPAHIETADLKALEVSKFHERDWGTAMGQVEGLRAVAEVLNGAVFVAQNVSFDWSFLRKAGNEYGIDFEKAVHCHKLDLASMAFGKLYDEPKLSRFSLRELTEYFGVKNANAHTALADARATFEVCKKLLAP